MTSEAKPVKIGRRLKVCVEQVHINTAIPANSGHCMVADAVADAFKQKFKRKAKFVSVDLQTIRLVDGVNRQKIIYFTPPVAQRGLLQFDQGIAPTPFQFSIAPCQVITIRDRKQTKPISERQRENNRKKMKTAHKNARLQRGVVMRHKNGQGISDPVKIDGAAPPVAVLSGARRQFGVKQAGSLNGPTQV